MFKEFFFFIAIINIPIFFIYNFFSKKINLFDAPDGERKFQKQPIPLTGGSIIIYNIIFFFLFDCLFLTGAMSNYFNTTREIFAFFFGLFFCFFLGVYDDKYNLNSYKKLLINFIIISIVVLLDDNLIIKKLLFSFLNTTVELRSISLFFTILCFLLFINALNMFDGINLQTGTYCLIIFFIFILKGVFSLLSISILFSLVIFLFYNYNNKGFLGDNGTQLLAFVISYIFIKSYNNEAAFLPEEIFIILSIPGFDMFRLFLFRIVKGKNPFNHDLNHLHHIISRKFSKIYTFIIIQLIIIFNISLYYFVSNKLIVLLSAILFYTFIIFLLRKKIS